MPNIRTILLLTVFNSYVISNNVYNITDELAKSRHSGENRSPEPS